MLAGEVVTDLPEFAESAIFFAIEPSHLFFDIITKIQIRSFSLRYTFPENLPYFPRLLFSCALRAPALGAPRHGTGAGPARVRKSADSFSKGVLKCFVFCFLKRVVLIEFFVSKSRYI